MCNFYENVYHHSNCRDPDDHFIHISLQGAPAERCNAGPHDRYVPIPGQCDECYPKHDQQPSNTTDSDQAAWKEYADEDLRAFFQEYDDADNEEDAEGRDSDGDICEFDMAWDLPAAVESVHVQDVETFLLEAVTLTRTENSVKAMSCQDYIREEYGALGLVLLENILSALYSPGNCYEDNTMEIYASYDIILVSLPGKLSYLKDMLLWLCLSFVTPIPGTVCISTAAITQDSTPILLPLQPIEETYHLIGKQLWYDMFDTAIIAQDPRLRTRQCAWLEMEYKLMVKLSGIQWFVGHLGGLLLRGHHTALTPLREVGDDHILWQFEALEHVHVLDSEELVAVKTPWMETLVVRRLRSKKALVCVDHLAEADWRAGLDRSDGEDGMRRVEIAKIVADIIKQLVLDGRLQFGKGEIDESLVEG